MKSIFHVILCAKICLSLSSGASVVLPQTESQTTNPFATTVDNYFESTLESQLSTTPNTNPSVSKHERTLILLKPDAVERRIVGKIIERFEDKGFNLVGMKLVTATKEMIEKHYSQYKSGPIHDKLIDYLTSGPLIAIIWEGENAVQKVRGMMGTSPLSQPGTIRGDFSLDTTFTVIHGSDSIEAANEEISIWFREDEIVNHKSWNITKHNVTINYNP
ncbi:Nucleoside diphosphate kinase [Pseudolycoriella hygida]|uniref:nucleoside-diphosphate kinase n=1 Tax=Pseudolycoriella hygida TaxID=35572 RepID=A0A9Q0N7Y3_9DIPT|nr:Nucleoside diphosphate kinase [Pseudolycoriella hygida]